MFNYDINANTDSGCIPKVEGCMDLIARNFNDEANIETNDVCEYNCDDSVLAMD